MSLRCCGSQECCLAPAQQQSQIAVYVEYQANHGSSSEILRRIPAKNRQRKLEDIYRVWKASFKRYHLSRAGMRKHTVRIRNLFPRKERDFDARWFHKAKKKSTLAAIIIVHANPFTSFILQLLFSPPPVRKAQSKTTRNIQKPRSKGGVSRSSSREEAE